MTGGMSYDDRVKNYMARHPGASLGRARTMAKGASLLNQTARGLGGGAIAVGRDRQGSPRCHAIPTVA